MAKIEIIGGKPDLPKLAKKGRIKLSPDGSVVGQPKNNVVQVIKKPIVHDSGVVIGELKIEVNGGHAKMEGSVWRVALSPEKYHKKVLADEKRKIMQGEVGFRPAAPELTEEEFDEYQEYKAFLSEKGVEIASDAEFYSSRTKKVGRPKKDA